MPSGLSFDPPSTIARRLGSQTNLKSRTVCGTALNSVPRSASTAVPITRSGAEDHAQSPAYTELSDHSCAVVRRFLSLTIYST
jgi:IS5 family transposase